MSGTTEECDTMMWELHCRQAFDEVGKKLDVVANSDVQQAKDLSRLNAKIDNGITSRVEEIGRRVNRIESRLWGVLAAVLTLAGAVIANLVVG